MTNEQREAIELVEYIADNTWTTKYIMSSDSKKADAVLSLIKEQQEKMENKDKQIDLMAEIFYKRFKAELLLEYGFESEEQLKQYFERKVEDVKD